MKHFKTPKGTELPLMDIKGKDYLQVAHRLVWMREDHPDWTINTDYVELGAEHAICKAVISDHGKVIATGHKFEDRKGFPDFIEKSETGAIGRALAACGYGTQFAPELDEGERLADAPTRNSPNPSHGARPAVRTQSDSVPAQKNGGVRAMASANHASEKQIEYIKNLYPKKGWSDERMHTYLTAMRLDSLSELNSTQASHLIEVLGTLKNV